ncbi:MAG TPA: DUF962 domain-containing protein [Saprospiraceae bacterium]|nr:DUF962 domain-containing protein [Saprospiraceae bacterium]
MEEKKYTRLKEFYPFYLTEHQNEISRSLHFVGTACFLIIVIYAFFIGNYKILIFAPFAGYGFAWIGHFFFEKNKPATFTYPGMSLASDFIMFWHIITGQLPRKLREAKQKLGINS